MSHAKKVEALVFFRKDMGEADRLVTFFTKEHGLIRAIAKGVRKIPSSRGGHLEPLTRVSVLLNESKAGVYVGAIETENYFQELHADSDATARVRRVLHVFMKFFDTGQSLPQMFDAFEASWNVLPTLPERKRRLVESSLYLQTLQLAGVLPDLDSSHAVHFLSLRECSVLRYLIARAEHASRLAVTDEEALHVEAAVHNVVEHVGMVYS